MLEKNPSDFTATAACRSPAIKRAPGNRHNSQESCRCFVAQFFPTFPPFFPTFGKGTSSGATDSRLAAGVSARSIASTKLIMDFPWLPHGGKRSSLAPSLLPC